GRTSPRGRWNRRWRRSSTRPATSSTRRWWKRSWTVCGAWGSSAPRIRPALSRSRPRDRGRERSLQSRTVMRCGAPPASVGGAPCVREPGGEERMAEPRMQTEASLVAELNDLLQLDHDAVQAYGIAIEAVEDERLRETLIAFRGDHERHIDELTELIRAHGGIPIETAHIPTGMFKAAVQRAGAARGDRALMLAFKANERQVRDKYRRHADAPHPPEVRAVLARAAADEERHYAWALEVLD